MLLASFFTFECFFFFVFSHAMQHDCAPTRNNDIYLVVCWACSGFMDDKKGIMISQLHLFLSLMYYTLDFSDKDNS